MAPNTPIRVLLVDDHAVVRAGYRRFLEHNRMMEVVGEAGSSDEAYQLFRLMKPDVVVMDISLPGASGIEATRRMLALDNRARVLMFSMHAQPAFARQALEAAANDADRQITPNQTGRIDGHEDQAKGHQNLRHRPRAAL